MNRRALARTRLPIALLGGAMTLAQLAIALGVLAGAGGAAARAEAATDEPKVIGYYVSWAAYGRRYTPKDIDPAKLTHVVYGFAKLEEGTLVLGDRDVDPGNFAELRRLRDANPRLKLLVAVGGWTGSKTFSDVALSESSRTRFAESAAAFVRAHGFDGLDIDWEYPVAGGASDNTARPEDKQNLTLLLGAVRSALDRAGHDDGRHYLLSIATGPSPQHLANVELDKIAAIVDWLAIMAYDFNGPWAPRSGYNAPLFPDPADPAPDAAHSNVAAAVGGHLEAGVPAAKLILGMPAYGRTWSGCAPFMHGEYQPCRGPGPGSWEDGALDFSDIEAHYATSPDFERRFNEAARVPFLTNPRTGQFITYDDVESFRHKVAFLKSKDLGGAMVWELSADRNSVLLGVLARGLLSASP